MLVVRATKKLLDRLGPVTLESGQTSTTRLGDWYASAWAWRPQVALFVSEATLSSPSSCRWPPQPRSWLASASGTCGHIRVWLSTVLLFGRTYVSREEGRHLTVQLSVARPDGDSAPGKVIIMAGLEIA